MQNIYNRDKSNIKGAPDFAGENEEKFHLLVDSVKDYAILMIDTNGYIVSWNKGAERIKGYTADEVLGKHISIFYTQEEIEKREPEDNLKKTVENGRFETEGWRVCKDGSLFWADIVFTALFNQHGELKGFAKIVRDITKQKTIENEIARLNETLEKRVIERTEELQRSERKFHDLFQNNPMAMWVIDSTSLKILDVNEAAIRHYGYTCEEFLAMNSIDLRPKDEKERYLQLHSDSKPVNYYAGLWKHLKKDGTIIIVEVSANDILFEGKPARIILSNDVTERIKAEEKIHKLNEEISRNEKRFRGLIENSHDIVGLLNPNSNPPYFYRSPSSYKITGWTDEEMEKFGALDLVHPDDILRVKNFTAKVLSNPGKSISITFRSRHKQGHYLWFEGVMTNMLHDESINGIVVNLRDITERKEAEEKLIRSERIYKTIASSIPGSAICIIDSDYTYLLIEGDMLEKIGYSKEQLLGNKVQDVLSPERYAEVLPDFQRVFHGESFTTESDRGEYHVVTRFVPLKDENNKVYAAMVVMIDVTELKKAERHIAELNIDLEQKVIKRTEQLESANKDLEAFSYSVSHDLRAPLRAVNGYAKMLEEDYFKVFDDEGKRLLKTVQDNAKKMGVLIDDLLAFSRLGRKEVNKSLVKMTDLTNNVIFELQRDVSYKAEIIVSELHPVLADHSLMTQVMMNLLSNAIKYSSKKEKPLIKISSEKKGNDIVYQVSDNGTGFDMKYAHKLFGVFQRLHGEDFEGTGVGLAIVQRIIVRHGGRIWTESKLGEGATFYFSLPEH